MGKPAPPKKGRSIKSKPPLSDGIRRGTPCIVLGKVAKNSRLKNRLKKTTYKGKGKSAPQKVNPKKDAGAEDSDAASVTSSRGRKGAFEVNASKVFEGEEKTSKRQKGKGNVEGVEPGTSALRLSKSSSSSSLNSKTSGSKKGTPTKLVEGKVNSASKGKNLASYIKKSLTEPKISSSNKKLTSGTGKRIEDFFSVKKSSSESNISSHLLKSIARDVGKMEPVVVLQKRSFGSFSDDDTESNKRNSEFGDCLDPVKKPKEEENEPSPEIEKNRQWCLDLKPQPMDVSDQDTSKSSPLVNNSNSSSLDEENVQKLTKKNLNSLKESATSRPNRSGSPASQKSLNLQKKILKGKSVASSRYLTRSDSAVRVLRNGKRSKVKNHSILDGIDTSRRKKNPLNLLKSDDLMEDSRSDFSDEISSIFSESDSSSFIDTPTRLKNNDPDDKLEMDEIPDSLSNDEDDDEELSQTPKTAKVLGKSVVSDTESIEEFQSKPQTVVPTPAASAPAPLSPVNCTPLSPMCPVNNTATVTALIPISSLNSGSPKKLTDTNSNVCSSNTIQVKENRKPDLPLIKNTDNLLSDIHTDWDSDGEENKEDAVPCIGRSSQPVIKTSRESKEGRSKFDDLLLNVTPQAMKDNNDIKFNRNLPPKTTYTDDSAKLEKCDIQDKIEKVSKDDVPTAIPVEAINVSRSPIKIPEPIVIKPAEKNGFANSVDYVAKKSTKIDFELLRRRTKRSMSLNIDPTEKVPQNHRILTVEPGKLQGVRDLYWTVKAVREPILPKMGLKGPSSLESVTSKYPFSQSGTDSAPVSLSPYPDESSCEAKSGTESNSEAMDSESSDSKIKFQSENDSKLTSQESGDEDNSILTSSMMNESEPKVIETDKESSVKTSAVPTENLVASHHLEPALIRDSTLAVSLKSASASGTSLPAAVKPTFGDTPVETGSVKDSSFEQDMPVPESSEDAATEMCVAFAEDKSGHKTPDRMSVEEDGEESFRLQWMVTPTKEDNAEKDVTNAEEISDLEKNDGTTSAADTDTPQTSEVVVEAESEKLVVCDSDNPVAEEVVTTIDKVSLPAPVIPAKPPPKRKRVVSIWCGKSRKIARRRREQANKRLLLKAIEKENFALKELHTAEKTEEQSKDSIETDQLLNNDENDSQLELKDSADTPKDETLSLESEKKNSETVSDNKSIENAEIENNLEVDQEEPEKLPKTPVVSIESLSVKPTALPESSTPIPLLSPRLEAEVERLKLDININNIEKKRREITEEEQSPEKRAIKEHVLSSLGLQSLRAVAAAAAGIGRNGKRKSQDGAFVSSGRLKTVIKVPKENQKDRKNERKPLRMVFKNGKPYPGGFEDLPLDIKEAEADLTVASQSNESSSVPVLNGCEIVTSGSTLPDSAGSMSAADLDGKGKQDANLVIPEKSSSFSIHPGRLCSDVCSYCFGKFGSLDTPCHVAQLKSRERQIKIMSIETHLAMDSCLCDACIRYVDRKANCPNTKPLTARKETKSRFEGSMSNCIVTGCLQEARRSLRKKWYVKIKKSVFKKCPIDLDLAHQHLPLPLCLEHYSYLEFFMSCGLCRRRLSRSQMYNLVNTAEINLCLDADGIPAQLSEKLFVCKLCRYYTTLRVKHPRSHFTLSTNQREFFNSYRKRILRGLNVEVSDSEGGEAEPEIPPDQVHTNDDKLSSENQDDNASKNKRKRAKTHPPEGEHADQSKKKQRVSTETAPKKDDERQPSQADSRSEQTDTDNSLLARLQAAVLAPSRKSSKSSKSKNAAHSSATESVPPGQPPFYPGEDELALHASFAFQFDDVPSEGREWEKCTSTLQFDKDTKKLWQELQRPYGSHSSFMRHLVLMERYWRQGELVLAPDASSRAASYTRSVQNRLKAYGSVFSVKKATEPAKSTCSTPPTQTATAVSQPLPARASDSGSGNVLTAAAAAAAVTAVHTHSSSLPSPKSASTNINNGTATTKLTASSKVKQKAHDERSKVAQGKHPKNIAPKQTTQTLTSQTRVSAPTWEPIVPSVSRSSFMPATAPVVNLTRSISLTAVPPTSLPDLHPINQEAVTITRSPAASHTHVSIPVSRASSSGGFVSILSSSNGVSVPTRTSSQSASITPVFSSSLATGSIPSPGIVSFCPSGVRIEGKVGGTVGSLAAQRPSNVVHVTAGGKSFSLTIPQFRKLQALRQQRQMNIRNRNKELKDRSISGMNTNTTPKQLQIVDVTESEEGFIPKISDVCSGDQAKAMWDDEKIGDDRTAAVEITAIPSSNSEILPKIPKALTVTQISGDSLIPSSTIFSTSSSSGMTVTITRQSCLPSTQKPLQISTPAVDIFPN